MSKHISLRLPDDVLAKIQERADADGCSLTAYIISVLQLNTRENPLLRRLELVEAAVLELKKDKRASAVVQPQSTRVPSGIQPQRQKQKQPYVYNRRQHKQEDGEVIRERTADYDDDE